MGSYRFIFAFGTSLLIVYGDVIIGVHGENFSMMFDKKEGGISSLKYNGFEYITRTPKVSFWRAMTDNDTGASEPYNLAQWYAAGKFAKYKTVSWLEQEDALKITFTYQAACVPTFEFTVTYTAHFDGKLGVSVNYAGVSGMSDMPVLALDFKMKKSFAISSITDSALMKITAIDAKEQDWDCGNLRQKKIFPAISIRRNVAIVLV
jgi:beta-galactosidase/beta-glucuronidase